MTQYGTLRTWAFVWMLVGVFGMIAAVIGSSVCLHRPGLPRGADGDRDP